jgi:hypothetical protein
MTVMPAMSAPACAPAALMIETSEQKVVTTSVAGVDRRVPPVHRHDGAWPWAANNLVQHRQS